MYVYMYVYICMYMYMYIYMCIYVYIYACGTNDFEIQMHCVRILAQMQLRNGYRRDRIHQGLALLPIRVFHRL